MANSKAPFVFFFLAALHSMWDPSSPTRDRTRVPCIGSAESQPLDRQGSPSKAPFFNSHTSWLSPALGAVTCSTSQNSLLSLPASRILISLEFILTEHSVLVFQKGFYILLWALKSRSCPGCPSLSKLFPSMMTSFSFMMVSESSFNLGCLHGYSNFVYTKLTSLGFSKTFSWFLGLNNGLFLALTMLCCDLSLCMSLNPTKIWMPRRQDLCCFKQNLCLIVAGVWECCLIFILM